MIPDDTIVAISSAVGPAARMIVRASGPQSLAIANDLCRESIASTQSSVRLCRLHFCDLIVPASIYTFIGPRSYTGQDSVEFHIPGNPLLARFLLETILSMGARQAEAGEFTARAFFNDKIDLTQAEGVAAAITAGSACELSAARQLMSGELSRRLRPIMGLLADTLALVEVGIDFSEEDVQFLTEREIAARVEMVRSDLRRLLDESARFDRLRHEPRVLLAGRPNAGKSTLLNALAGMERAIVSPIAGTTRDALSAEVTLPRGKIQLMDVAGIEEASGDPSEIDRGMKHRASQVIEECDLLILVREAADDREELDLFRPIDLRVISKIDLAAHAEHEESTVSATVAVSAATGEGMDRLRDAIDQIAFGSISHQHQLALATRHSQAIEQSLEILHRAMNLVSQGHYAELLAAELRSALDELAHVLGLVTPDDILGKIFSAFCIGK